MPESAQSMRKRRALRPRGLAGRIGAPLLLGALQGVLGVPAACGGGPWPSQPPVSTAPIAPAPSRQEPAAPSPPTRRIVHVIEPGETLWEIGRHYGVTVDALMRANDIGPAEVRALQVGRVLRIPDDGGPPTAEVRAVPRHPRVPPRRASSTVPNTDLLAAAYLGQARDRYEAADFEGAIEDARAAGRLLRGLEDSPARRGQRARASLVEGMAEAALGDSTEALASFRDARSLDPDLSLDPATTSPKLLSIFQEAGAGP